MTAGRTTFPQRIDYRNTHKEFGLVFDTFEIFFVLDHKTEMRLTILKRRYVSSLFWMQQQSKEQAYKNSLTNRLIVTHKLYDQIFPCFIVF